MEEAYWDEPVVHEAVPFAEEASVHSQLGSVGYTVAVVVVVVAEEEDDASSLGPDLEGALVEIDSGSDIQAVVVVVMVVIAAVVVVVVAAVASLPEQRQARLGPTQTCFPDQTDCANLRVVG